ncbi:MAG TPA: glucose-6-phosphate isomerase [Stellaceae bacterium]|nr:glucose-6-phosphate isomerase [Stellaceae bacterium]
MLYRQDVSGCLLERIGALGLGAGEVAAMLKRAEAPLATLRAKHAEGSEPLLAIPAQRDDLTALASVAEEFRQFEHVLILGTGGSSLGGQTVYALADRGFGPRKGTPRLHFLDNIDPLTFDALREAIDFSRTGAIAISKSGGTPETLTQFMLVLDALGKRVGRAELGKRCLVLTEPAANPLRALAEKSAMRILDHHPDVGGRFSVLSNVGMLPAMIAGLDAAALRRGAEGALEATLKAEGARAAAPALGAALGVGLAELRGLRTSVLMPYADGLAHFGLWYRQLWAESLGKDGKGTTPIRAMGTVDQHSQLQLYLAGPADKMFTLVTGEIAGTGGRAAPDLLSDPSLGYLTGKQMGDLLDAEQRATEQSLIRNGRPTRRFHLTRLDEKTLGGLLMHFMLETIIAADLLGVNAFDQPAVEEGKVIARQYLGGMGRQAAQ